ncbi:MAG: response regulator transcription factor [Spirulina sp. SIO3F2]|nr:response regulator transcription factor [Spirulina sp. SIO3F2]
MKPPPIRILLVEDHVLLRRGLQGQFSLVLDCEVVGEADDGEQAIELAAQLQPDIILMDIEMPVLDGIAATQTIKKTHPEIRVLALSAFGKDESVLGMLAAGADGYCLKSIDWEQLLSVVRVLQKGGTYLDPKIAHKLTSMLKSSTNSIASPATATLTDEPPQSSEIAVLTKREQETLRLISEGLSNKEIAQQLHLSYGTVKAYVRTILNKLSVNDRVQAAAKAIREGLI